MIFSKLNGGDDLSAYPAAIQRALAYLRDTDIMSLELGRHELEGDDMFVNVMDMTTHPMEGSHPEVHKKYIDLMYWPEGGERIGVAPYLGTEPVFEARPENDISLLEDVATSACWWPPPAASASSSPGMPTGPPSCWGTRRPPAARRW